MLHLVLRRTSLPIQPRRADPITISDIERGIKSGTLRRVTESIYEEIDAPTIPADASGQMYLTRDMQAADIEARERGAIIKRRRRKRKIIE